MILTFEPFCMFSISLPSQKKFNKGRFEPENVLKILIKSGPGRSYKIALIKKKS